jgi:hypothetical protein
LTEIIAFVGLVLSLLGATPILAAFAVNLSRRRRGRRVIGFDRDCAVDVVLTLSSETPSRPGKRMVRPLTGIGQVIGAAEVSRCLGRFYLNKTMRVHLSGHITNRLDGDEVILGGPVRNEEAERFLGRVPSLCHVNSLIYSDESPCSIFVSTPNGDQWGVEEFDAGIVNGFPRRDLCLIVAARAPNHGGSRRRIIWCSGFTSYGTSVGAQYFFGELAVMRRRQLTDVLGSKNPFNEWGILIVEAEFSGPTVTRVTPVFSWLP